MNKKSQRKLTDRIAAAKKKQEENGVQPSKPKQVDRSMNPGSPMMPQKNNSTLPNNNAISTSNTQPLQTPIFNQKSAPLGSLTREASTPEVNKLSQNTSNAQPLQGPTVNQKSAPLGSLTREASTTGVNQLSQDRLTAGMGRITRNAETDFKPLFMRPTPGVSITFNHLRIAPYEVVEILDVKTTQAINEHGTLYVKALLNDEQGEKYAKGSASGTNVVLIAGDHVLFQGIVKDLSVQFRGGSYYLEVHGISYSYLLDIKPISCSYQDISMTYETIAQQILAKYGGHAMDMASNRAPINQFIMCYQETEWQFLMRLASHFNSGLVCDSRFDAPMVYFGVAHAQQTELDHFNYTVIKDIKRYKTLAENGLTNLSEADFLRYEVETNQILNIGDKVKFQNQTLYVLEVTGCVDKGIFINRCLLSPKNGLSQPYINHDEIAGCSFTGTVLCVKNDRIKIHLDIDPVQSIENARFFPYSTPYSSKSGAGFYCMPELRDRSVLYFPNSLDHSAYAISSVHEPVTPPPPPPASGGNMGVGGGASGGAASGGIGSDIAPGGMRDDPEVKSFRNEAGMEIRLTPEGIFLLTEGSIITLTEEDGIMIHSENDIAFKSEKNIIIAAEEDVNIIGTEGIELQAETASVTIEEDVHLIGQEIKSNGGV